MNKTIENSKKKLIDIPEDVFRYLSIKAAIEGVSLKKYIENILINAVDDMDDKSAFAFLSKAKPKGRTSAGEKKKPAAKKKRNE